MRWEGREGSDNVDDRRGKGGGAAPVMGGGILVLIIGALITYLSGGNPLEFLVDQAQNQGQQAVGVGQGDPQAGPREDEPLFQMSRVILKDTEEVWKRLYPKISRGQPYREPTLVTYDARVKTEGCGNAGAQAGPFYCGADNSVYIDLSFFKELEEKFNAPGEFAFAYVIAHEVGHHVQNQLGLLSQVQRQKSNEMSVRLELQADFLAGVWAHHAQKQYQILEPGDIESGMNAAKQVGDDMIMKNAGVRPVPENFTHGSSAQRVKWFTLGLKTGDPSKMMDLFDLPYEAL